MCIVLTHVYVFKGTCESMCAPVHMAVDTLCALCLWAEVSTTLDSAWTQEPRPCSDPHLRAAILSLQAEQPAQATPHAVLSTIGTGLLLG